MRASLSLLAIIVLLSTISLPVNAQDAATVDGFIASLAKKKQGIETVRYRVSGQQVLTSTLLKYGIREPKGRDEDQTRPESGVLIIDFLQRKIRFDQKSFAVDSVDPPVVPLQQSFAYNGQDFRLFFDREANTTPEYTPHERRPDLNIRAVTDTGLPPLEVVPLLWNLGIVSTSQDPLPPASLWNPMEKERFQEHKREEFQGRKCIVIRTVSPTNKFATSHDDFWVDPERDYSILKAVTYANGQRVTEYIVNYEQKGERWQITDWTVTMFLYGSPMKIFTLKVDEAAINVPLSAADFEIPLKTGMLISEDGRLSRVEPDGRLRSIDPAEPPPREHLLYVGLILGAIVALILVVGWFFLSRR